MTPSPDVPALFAPSSVAVVGASDDPVKWGHWLALRALRGEHRRTVHLVNRRGGEVLGRPALRSLAQLPEPVELAVLAVPAASLEGAVAESIAAGARAIVAITGSAEDGDAGGVRDTAIAAMVRDAGVRLLGPNCLGVFDAEAELELVSNDLPSGSIGLISQSGNLGLEIAQHAARAGLGFSRFASLGNQADLTLTELVHALAAHEPTRAIAVYAEDFVDGRAFAQAAAGAGKPVVLLAIEHTDATARAVRSHTGALASEGAVIDAACGAAGIERVRSPQELVDVAEALLRQPRPRGQRVAVLADGGGHAGVAAGLAAAAGLEVPALSAPLAARLREELGPAAATANPIDLAGAGERDVTCFERVADLMLESGEVDALLMTGYFGGYGEYAESLRERELAVAERLAAVVPARGRPLYVHTMNAESPAADVLRRRGVPVQPAIERAVATLARFAGAAAPVGVPALPPPAAAAGDTSYTAMRALLADEGVPFVDAVTVAGAQQALVAAERLGYPVVVKALGLLHKSDVGGVVLDVRDSAALAVAVEDLVERLAPAGLSVERMAPLHEGVELIAGARWDPRFGPIALVGLGGIHTETLADVRMGLAPLTPHAAERLLRGLRGAQLLLGARGRAPVDLRAAAEAVAALSRVAAEHPELAELEVNPLLALPEGALALDARALT
jgi:acyl-CoA synthetase (NDP forming)